MIETTLTINDMVCGMCEAHIDNLIRTNFEITKVKSSHRKNQTAILSHQPLDKKKLTETIEATGYHVSGFEQKPVEKKNGFGSGFFGRSGR